MRWFEPIAACLVAACGTTTTDETPITPMEDGGADAGAAGESGAGGGGVSGASGTGGLAGGFGGADTGVPNDAGAGDAEATDAGEGGQADPCVEMCTMAVGLNCSGGPNDVSECPTMCANLEAKGAQCEQASDAAYQCVVDAGPSSLACGPKGAHAKCGYCDEFIVELEKACGFTTGCV